MKLFNYIVTHITYDGELMDNSELLTKEVRGYIQYNSDIPRVYEVRFKNISEGPNGERYVRWPVIAKFDDLDAAKVCLVLEWRNSDGPEL